MPIYRKKPVEIEAQQLPSPQNSDTEADAFNRAAAWCGGEAFDDAVDGPCILIDTLEGQMKALPGDYVICGVKGEFYPCKADIFEATYEKVGD